MVAWCRISNGSLKSCCAGFIMGNRNISAFSISSQYCYGTGWQISLSWNTGTCMNYTTFADDLGMQGTRSLASILLEYSCYSTREVNYPAFFNSSPLSATYMRQSIGSALVQIMACRLFGTKPLSEPILDYHLLELKKQTFSEISIKTQNFWFSKMHLKMLSAKMAAIVSRKNELRAGVVLNIDPMK